MKTQVLIIDDEQSIRQLCTRALNKIGISSESVGSAEEGLDMLRNNKYNVVLLDVPGDADEQGEYFHDNAFC